jgi:(2Fe-2S) ferredoxin
MCKSQKNHTEFNLTGTIQTVWSKDGKPKAMTLLTSLGLLLIKLSKQARTLGISDLAPGHQVQVIGQKRQDLKTGMIKLKADRVLSTSQPISTTVLEPLQQPPVKPGKILVCQKSDCRKRGGDDVCEVLQQELAQRGLKDQVTIQKTGCLKRCKSGPHLVMLPDKTRYSKVEPKKIPALIQQHF